MWAKSILGELFDRRGFLRSGLLAGAATVAGASQARAQQAAAQDPDRNAGGPAPLAAGNGVVGQVSSDGNGFDPHEILTDWDIGEVEKRSDGRTVRSFRIVAEDKDIEIAPGLFFPAWTYNGRVPGPSLRATEGEWIRVEFTNAGSHPHTIHFHGIHSARMDGIPGAGQINPGESFTYEFPALPFGCHLYHCHAFPLKRHIHKGLYGAFIIDPDPDRHPDNRAVAESRLLGHPRNAGWQELVMVMNGFDTNFDDENEVYAVNSIAFAYTQKPIVVDRARPIRIYLVNVTEFDPVNSFHLHANFFDYFDHGTTLTPTLRTVDTIMQCQAQRGIIETSFAEHEPGRYMFHAHQTEFAELGWSSFFEVR